MLARCVLLAILAMSASGTADAKERYFPPNAFDGAFQKDDFRIGWYSKHLAALSEPSLSTGDIKAETYRILWLRTFHAPMSFRLTLMSDGTSVLITKKTNGKGGYEPGKLVLNKGTKVDKQETRRLIEKLEQAKFWRLATRMSALGGLDGSQWIMEGVKGGEYHVIDRWGGEGMADWALPLMQKSGEDLQPIY